MKLFFNLMLLGAMMVAHADEIVNIPDLKACTKISWLVPNPDVPNAVTVIDIEDKAVVKKLIEIFSAAKPTEGINPTLFEGESKEGGLLLFHFNERGWGLHIYPFVNKRRSANVCVVKEIKDGCITLYERSISSGIETGEDYRGILRAIPRPAAGKRSEVLKVRFANE